MTSADDIQAIRERPLWSSAESLRNAAKEASGRTATDRHTLSRLSATLTYLLGYKSLDAHLFPSAPYMYSVFQTLEGSVIQAESQLEGWDAGAAMSAQTVAQIDQQCDRIVETLSQAPWPSLQKESRAHVISEAGVAFQQATEASVELLLSEVESSRNEVILLGERIKGLEREALARGEQAESALREIEDARSTNVAVSKAALNTAMKEQLMESHVMRNDFAEQSRKNLESLAANARRGEKLVKLVGDQAVGEGYARFARKEMSAHRLWNAVGVLAGVAVVIYLGWEFRELNEVTLQTAIVRVALSVPGLGIAAYAFQQASRRHKQSVEARYRALDLLALGPFTNEMDVEQQTKLRVALGQRLFASNQQDGDVSSETQQPEFSLTQLQSLVDFIKSAQNLNK